jgi:drug/metabolite transporter (DMT)-like permease
VPPLAGVSLRFALACALLLAIAAWRRLPLGREPRERWLWLANGLLSFCVSYGLVYWSEQWVPSGLAAVLFATFPLFVALLAHVWLPGERLHARAALGTLAGFGGIAVIFSEDLARLGGPGVPFAAAVSLLAPLASAVANVTLKRFGKGVHPVSLTAVPMGIAGAVMGILATAAGEWAHVRLDAIALGALLYLAVPGSVVTFLLYYWLLGHLPATRLALVAYAIPVVAVGVGAVVLEESLTARVLAGSALVVVGVATAAGGARPRGGGYPPPGAAAPGGSTSRSVRRARAARASSGSSSSALR